MDINALKNEAQEMKLLKAEVKNRYEGLVNIGKEVTELVVLKLGTKKEELIRQFSEYFTFNAFEVTKKGDTLKAIYDDLIVNLHDKKSKLNSYEVYFDLEIPLKRLNYTIVIKAGDKDFDKLYYKKNLDKLLNHGFKDVSERIENMKDKEDLKKVLNDINENLSWYSKTIENFDNIKFVFTLYKSHEEYESFKDLFEALEAP
ncbi:hypothetical protein [Priestia megaterium]|uniref:hypothetical protein n=1 Tax=Priestia megaterium TaxID=1404 RepID=UPI003CFCAABE